MKSKLLCALLSLSCALPAYAFQVKLWNATSIPLTLRYRYCYHLDCSRVGFATVAPQNYYTVDETSPIFVTIAKDLAGNVVGSFGRGFCSSILGHPSMLRFSMGPDSEVKCERLEGFA